MKNFILLFCLVSSTMCFAQDRHENYTATLAIAKEANRLPETFAMKNDELAKKYNPQGHFPLVVMLDNKGDVLRKAGYFKGTPETYIAHLNAFLK